MGKELHEQGDFQVVLERTRGQYMDKAKHTASAKEEREYYEEYPKTQMFDKTTLAKCIMSWEQEPHTVCKGGEACYTAFFKKMTQAKVRFDERAFMQTIGKLILFRTIDAYYGKDGINLAGYKANMVAFTMSVIAKITNKAIDFESIWGQQSVITPSLYNELGGDVATVYAKLLAGNKSITYKVKSTYTAASGRKVNKWEVKSIADSELEKLKDTVNEEMKKAFHLICEEGQEKITLKSLQKVAKELGENMTTEELQEMIEEADRDGDGEIGEEDTLTWLTTLHEPASTASTISSGEILAISLTIFLASSGSGSCTATRITCVSFIAFTDTLPSKVSYVILSMSKSLIT